MSTTIQYIIVFAVLAGCVFFMVKSIRKIKSSKIDGCCGCSLKDSCKDLKNKPDKCK